MSQKIEQYSRILHHRTTVSGQQFTVPISNDHTDETWLATDLYIGELGINVSDNTIYMRTNNGIIQIATGTSSGGSTASNNIWNFSSPDIIIGTTYSADSVSPRSGYYTDLGTTALRWKNLYLGGSSNGYTTIDVNAGIVLKETTNYILTSNGTNANTPIEIWGTASATTKNRPLHLNSKSVSIVGTPNSVVSIASKNSTMNDGTNNVLIGGDDVTISTGLTTSVHLGYGYSKTNYNSQMVTVGNLAVRGIADDGSSQYTKSDWITKQAKLRTSNALSTTLVTIPWSDDGVAQQLKVYLIGVAIDNAQYVYSAEIIATMYGGASYTGTIVGTPILNAVSSWPSSQPDCEVTVDNTNCYVKVTGLASTSIQWLCTYSYHRLINVIP